MQVIEKVSTDTIVKAAELKERLGNNNKIDRDPEAKKHFVKEYIQTFSGELIKMQDIDAFYDWKGGTANRYVQTLLDEGYVTFKIVAGGGVGVRYRYFYHSTPLPRESRTPNRNSKGKRLKAGVTTTRLDRGIAERTLQAQHDQAEKERAARAATESERARTMNRERLEYVEGKVWEYLRETDIQTILAVDALKGFAKFMREQAGE